MEIWYQSCDWEATSVLNAGMQVLVGNSEKTDARNTSFGMWLYHEK